MKLNTKKSLASKVLKVGKSRIVLVKERLEEIKEAITKQDIRDLKADGAIRVKEIKGRKKVVRRKRRRGMGKIKKKVNTRKKDYVIMTRKLRKYLANIKARGEISPEDFKQVRNKIRNREFSSLRNMKEYLKLGDRK